MSHSARLSLFLEVSITIAAAAVRTPSAVSVISESLFAFSWLEKTAATTRIAAASASSESPTTARLFLEMKQVMTARTAATPQSAATIKSGISETPNDCVNNSINAPPLK